MCKFLKKLDCYRFVVEKTGFSDHLRPGQHNWLSKVFQLSNLCTEVYTSD